MFEINPNWSDVFKNSQFWTAFVGLLAMILVSVFPEFRAEIDALAPIIVTIIVTAIGGQSLVQFERQRQAGAALRYFGEMRARVDDTEYTAMLEWWQGLNGTPNKAPENDA